MENGDLGEKGSKTGDLDDGIRQKSRGNTSKLSKEDLVVILSELIMYAEKRLYSNRTRVKDKPTWARILRESVTELVKVMGGELEAESLEGRYVGKSWTENKVLNFYIFSMWDSSLFLY